MEKSVVKQHIKEILKVETKFSVIEECREVSRQSQSKSLINLKAEERILKIQLENLKKENFSLIASIQAWKSTREQKEKELVEAESKLNEVYNTIWSKREEFCVKADNFISQYGILSQWWKEKIDKFFNPLQEKSNGKYQNENFERVVQEAQGVEVFEKEEKEDRLLKIYNVECSLTESFVCGRNEAHEEILEKPCSDSEDTFETHNNEKKKDSFTFIKLKTTATNEEDLEKLEYTQGLTNGETSESSVTDGITKNPKKKKVRFSKENEITIVKENSESLKTKFFSLMDMETVKKANRFKSKTRILVKNENLTNFFK